ncbi:MAG: D-fructose-6-phosphate amidotransferase [Halieaceae bacterium]|nr:D-fructose-6-phosphate amidotransferase [Halieaceae bacterium]|tara:strand:+ start:1083 stop:1388 length:306 start_codon:yes stop_codon:yes gene_type:complete
MKKGYFVAQVDVTDPEGYRRYLEAGAGLVDAAGGKKIVVPNTEHELVEGDWDPERLVVIEFPSYEALRGWYFSDEYTAARQHRIRSSKSWVMLVEGPDIDD